jgi:predicted CoA-binding protein
MASFDPIADLLQRAKTIAVVGLSCNPMRASHGVSAYMQSHGYRIIPVNPQIDECLGEKAYASILDAPEKIDVVNIFRRPEFVEEIVDQAIQLKIPAIWMQEDVIHEKAAEKARQAGIFVVMDLCILKNIAPDSGKAAIAGNAVGNKSGSGCAQLTEPDRLLSHEEIH